MLELQTIESFFNCSSDFKKKGPLKFADIFAVYCLCFC